MIKPLAICCAVAPVDMRRGMDGLALIVQQHLGRKPCDGTAYIFCNKARTRLKMLCWDGNGVWLCQRRLHQGSFRWANGDDSVFVMTTEQWQWLTQGVDWQRLNQPLNPAWSL